MIKRKEDNNNFFGIVLFILLFFLLISSPSDTTGKHLNDTLKFELISEFHSSPLSADIVTVINLPLFHKSWVTSQDKMNFRHEEGTLKICSDNRKVNQQMLSLQKDEFVTKNIAFYRFYYHLFSLVSSELPSLS